MGFFPTANILDDIFDGNDEQNDDEEERNSLYENVALQVRALHDSIVIHCKFTRVSPSRRAFDSEKKKEVPL